MNKATKKRVLDQKRKRSSTGRSTARAAYGGELRFDNGVPSRVSARDLETYFDDSWRMLGSDKDWND